MAPEIDINLDIMLFKSGENAQDFMTVIYLIRIMFHADGVAFDPQAVADIVELPSDGLSNGR
ncbi:hypothetical protein LZ563_12255 [Klebsiella pneumoniae]|uniref:hypothetical protein n=1 Tax=Klebsiella pneumoniae TaxID=573 RepID=UPI001F3D83C0|nr:hypothetical protein [Klebsiella pneumoniae]MCF2746615.1 hypothetical protein [Klebsiella pneumoniae]